MNKSTKKRTRRIRRAWAAWWQPQVDEYNRKVDEYNRKFDELIFGVPYQKAMLQMWVSVVAPELSDRLRVHLDALDNISGKLRQIGDIVAGVEASHGD